MKTFLILVAASGFLMGAEPKTVDAVKAADKAWAAASVKADESALTRLLAPDLQYIHSNADIDTRASFMANMKNGVRAYQRLDHEGMDVRLYGNTAVLTATAQVVTATKGQAAPVAHLRFIHVWVYQQGRWQMVAHQSLRLAN
jgi:uncharacterized protein (TIGR02246 family)